MDRARIDALSGRWDQARDRLRPILAADRNAVAVYLGNPNAHNLSNLLYGKVLLRALGTRNSYSASTVDQFPKQMASALMFGTGTTVPPTATTMPASASGLGFSAKNSAPKSAIQIGSVLTINMALETDV